jgi:hypothetical protein
MSRFARPTPQAKIESIGGKLGIPGLKKQQGTTRIIYDTLPLVAGARKYRFFEGSNQRNFPFSNLGSFGNKLEVGESLVIQNIYLSIIKQAEDTLNSNVYDIESAPGNLKLLNVSEINLIIGNQQVLKPIPVLSFDPRFNKGNNADSNSFHFETLLTIPPLMEFYMELQQWDDVAVPADATYYLRLSIEGTGSILAPRATF